MATLYTTYVTHVRPSTPRHLADVREEPVGTFLGLLPPDARVGSFANVPHLRWQGAGTFRGDPDRQRQGSFGDHDLTDVAPNSASGSSASRMPPEHGRVARVTPGELLGRAVRRPVGELD